MQGIKTTTFSILALGLLTGSAVGVTAQDEEAADPMAPAFFEVEYITSDVEFVDGTYEEVAPGLERFDGEIVRGQLIEAEDPRASGEWTMVESIGVAFSEAPVGSRSVADVRARSVRLENEAGAWEGTGWGASNAPESPTEARAVVVMNVLDGTGAYEGLTLFFANTADQTWGWIMPDSLLPAIPELPAE
jgi:hypothetical protein